MTLPPRVRALSIHADYRCRHTGVCCSSGWDIPVEPGVELHLRNALGSGTLRVPEAVISSPLPPTQARRASSFLRPVSGFLHGARVVLATHSSGRCLFLDPDRRCAVHRQLGPEALPAACRDFPRVVTRTPLGVSITLSHYCPTAAAMLFTPVTLSDSRPPGREGSTVAIVENPPGFPPSWPYEGLDARDALPPLLRPGVLMDWPRLERWETFAVTVLGDERRSPEAALDVLAAAAEEARRWTPEDGAFEGYFERVLSSRGAPSGRATRDPQCDSTPRADGGSLARNRHSDALLMNNKARAGERRLARGDPGDASVLPCGPGARATAAQPGPSRGTGHWLKATRVSRGSGLGMTKAWSLLADCVPHRSLLPPPPEGLDDADAGWVAPGWPSLALPVRRWLAAKAFASWSTLQGEGVRTTALGLRVALRVLRAEAARGCAEADRALDAELLKEAVRRADLLLVHLADPEGLARRLGRCEHAPARA